MKKAGGIEKGTYSAVAILLALALALGGTFAMQSIGQDNTAERETYVNPGGRLHYDLSGWQASAHNGGVVTEDIYVENFGTQNIYARVRLDEYMEIGDGAGLMPDDKDYKNKWAKSLAAGAEIDDKTTWTTHIPDSADPGLERGSKADFHTYWDWTLGREDTTNNPEGKTVYMPTFNKNGNSLAVDVNGTMDGGGATALVQYDDWVGYQVGDTADGVRDESKDGDGNYVIPRGAFYAIEGAAYSDSTNPNEKYGNSGTAGVNYSVSPETHTAKETLPGGVCTMAQWKDMSEKQRNSHGWWVYDTDGWAYWSQPIKPDTATGLLLDRVEPTRALYDLGEEWYYAIHAVGQFVTADDLGRKDGTGFYTDPDQAPSEDATELLESIGVKTTVDGTIIITQQVGMTSDPVEVRCVEPDAPHRLSVVYTDGGGAVADLAGLTFSVQKWNAATNRYEALDPNSGTSVEYAAYDSVQYWLLLVDSAYESIGDILHIVAENAATGLYAARDVEVNTMSDYLADLIQEVTPGSAQTITLDGMEWYVLGTIQENVSGVRGKVDMREMALLLSKDVVAQRAYITDMSDMNTTIKAWLNADWISGQNELLAGEAGNYAQGGMKGQVTLLTEADVFGTSEGVALSAEELAAADTTTLGYMLTAPDSAAGWTANYSDGTNTAASPWWLLGNLYTDCAYVTASGEYATAALDTAILGVRPAVWFSLGEIPKITNASSVVINGTTVSLAQGATAAYSASHNTASGIIWSSSDEAVATVTDSGSVTVLSDAAPGQTVTITAASADDLTVKGSFTVLVTAP